MQQQQYQWWKKISARFLPRGGEFRRDPRLSWNAILLSCLIGICAALGVGYLTYYRAVQVDSPETTIDIPRSTLRPGDVKVVLDTYQQKKERFTQLLSDEPTFLSPEKGAAQPQEENSAPSSGASTSSAALP